MTVLKISAVVLSRGLWYERQYFKVSYLPEKRSPATDNTLRLSQRNAVACDAAKTDAATQRFT